VARVHECAVRLSGQQGIGQSRCALDLQPLVEGRAPQVAVHKRHSTIEVGGDQGQIEGAERLADTWFGADHSDAAKARATHEAEVGAERPKRFDDLVVLAGRHLGQYWQPGRLRHLLLLVLAGEAVAERLQHHGQLGVHHQRGDKGK